MRLDSLYFFGRFSEISDSKERIVERFNQFPNQKRFVYYSFLGLIAGHALLASSNRSSAAEPAFTIHQQGDHLVVEADGAAVEKVLAGLGKRGGFDVIVLSGAQRPPVDGRIAGENVGEVLRKVLRDRNYALLYDDSDQQRLEEVVILSPPPQHRWVPNTVSKTPDRSPGRWRQIRAGRAQQRRAAAHRAERHRRRAR